MKSIEWSNDIEKMVRSTKSKAKLHESATKTTSLSKSELEGFQKVMQRGECQYVGVASSWL